MVILPLVIPLNHWKFVGPHEPRRPRTAGGVAGWLYILHRMHVCKYIHIHIYIYIYIYHMHIEYHTMYSSYVLLIWYWMLLIIFHCITSCFIYTWSAGSCNMDVNWWDHGPHGSKMSTHNLCFLSSLSLSLAPADLLADEKKSLSPNQRKKNWSSQSCCCMMNGMLPKMQWLLSTNVSCSWIAAPLRFLKIAKDTGNRGRPLFEAIGVQSSRGWKMVSFPSCKDDLSRAAGFFENYEPSLSFNTGH